MFHELLVQGRACSTQPALISADSTTTWGELAEASEALRDAMAPLARRRVGIGMRADARCLATLASLDQLQCDVFLLDDRLDAETMMQLATSLRLGAVVLEGREDAGPPRPGIEPLPQEEPGSGQSSITILTSGTSGKPKAARHTWKGLVRPVRQNATAKAQRWLLTYRPQLYAGLQVMLQCLVNHGTLVVPSADATPSQIAHMMRTHRVRCCSATPSYWRRLLLVADPDILGAVRLQQITLGGEVVDQQVLDGLHQRFPHARIVHIYATTELGRCFSVSDGQEGFPTAYLEPVHPSSGRDVQVTVRDGELCVRSANAMESYDGHSVAGAEGMSMTEDGWYRTGDLVEVRGDRVHFVARRSDMINVGGNKVSPLEVERVIRNVPGVADVRVFAKESSIAGQLVACQIVPEGNADSQDVRQAVSAVCQTKLASFQRPRFIELVEQIELTEASKRRRRG